MSGSPERGGLVTRSGRIVVLVVLAIIGVALLVAPVLAWRWLQNPFPGMFLEPTLVLSPMRGCDWARLAFDPPLEQPDHLIAIDGQPVERYGDVAAVLRRHAVGDRVQVRVDRPGGQVRQETITLTAFPWRDLGANFVLPYLVALAYLGVGVWVYWVQGRDAAGQVLAGLSAGMALILGALFDLNTTHRLSILWAAAVPLAAAAAMHFALVFPQVPRFVRRVPLLRLLPYLPATILAFRSALRVYDTAHPWLYIDRWRNGYLFAALGILFMVGMMIYRLVRPASPLVRQQSRIVLSGTALGFLPLLPWLLLNVLGNPVPFLAPVYAPLFVLFPLSIAYAVLRYRLLDVDRLLGRGLSYGLLTAVVVIVYFGLVNGLSMFFAVRADDPLLLSLFVLALILIFNPLRNWVQQLVDRVFLRESVDYRAALQGFSRDLTHVLDLDAVLAEVGRRIEDSLHPDIEWVFLYDEDGDSYVGRPVGLVPQVVSRGRFAPDGALACWLRDHQECLYLLGEQHLPDGLVEARERLHDLGAVLCAPLRTGDRLSGWLALGPKRSGQPYRSDELAFLSALADQSALAIENGRLFANVRRNLDAITEMKTLMDDVFGSIPSGVITTDVQGRVTLLNQAAGAILGLRAGQVVGQPYQQALQPLSDVLPYLMEQVGRSETPLAAYEVQTELPGRGVVWLRLSLSPLKDDRGAISGVTIVMDDLTEQRRLEAQERFIRETFQRYVSPAVVLRLLEDPGSLKLGGQRQEITALFADIRGFTRYSEGRDPEGMVEVLNHYLTIGAEAILAEEGTLDKFMGDALMALFNAPLSQPDHVLRAVRAALSMQEAVRQHHRRVLPYDQLAYGVGIAVGEAVVGNVGAARQLDYTAIGVSVNLAKRLQEHAAAGQVLLNDRAYERIEERVQARPLTLMEVEGFRTPLQVYELIGLRL